MKIRVESDLQKFSELSLEDAFKEYERVQASLSDEEKWKLLENLSSRVMEATEASTPPMKIEEVVAMLESRHAEGWYDEE